MAISIFDLFTIGIGPSSSHTVGPMRAAFRFARRLRDRDLLAQTRAIQIQLFGSLGLTGKGHGSDRALLLGLEGETPELVDIATMEDRLASIRSQRCLRLLGEHAVTFSDKQHLIFHRRKRLPLHPNGLRFAALADDDSEIDHRIYYSIGGGFVVDEETAEEDRLRRDRTVLPHLFSTGAELLRITQDTGHSIAQVTITNECAWRTEDEIREKLRNVWQAMQDCVERGCHRGGVLPGALGVRRRAAALYQELTRLESKGKASELEILDWVNLYALAVNEENAAGGRVVTAPTNGAAGIVPAVLHYYTRFCDDAEESGVERFLLTAGAIGILYKTNASISGAEVGCQGEVGVACSMAAAGLTEALGGSAEQVENAAEIGMEHNLGLTCDPIGGLVQIPCIERNAMGAVKAINACRLALRGDGKQHISLDRVMATMMRTGRDMNTKYKETSKGGLAVNVSEC